MSAGIKQRGCCGLAALEATKMLSVKINSGRSSVVALETGPMCTALVKQSAFGLPEHTSESWI